MRFIICENDSDCSVGTVDLYDVNFKHGFASVGILIAEEKARRKGRAKESLGLLIEYARDILELTNLQCSIHGDNEPSVQLFESLGFLRIGLRKNWFIYKGKRNSVMRF